MKNLARLCALSIVAACLAPAPARAQRPQGGAEKQDAPGRLYPVMSKYKWGYVDRTGRLVVEPKYDQASVFDGGLAVVMSGLLAVDVEKTEPAGGLVPVPVGPEGIKWEIIDATGKAVARLPADRHYDATPFAGGLARFSVYANGKGYLHGYMDGAGRVVVEPQFISAGFFREGLANVCKDYGGRCGFIDRAGKFVIQPQFTVAGVFSERLAHASTSDCVFATMRGDDSPCGYGYVDKSGRFVVEQRYEHAEPFREGVAHVIERGGRGYIDREGKFIWKPSK